MVTPMGSSVGIIFPNLLDFEFNIEFIFGGRVSKFTPAFITLASLPFGSNKSGLGGSTFQAFCSLL